MEMTYLKKSERIGWFLPPLLFVFGQLLYGFEAGLGLAVGSLWMLLSFFFTRTLIEKFFTATKRAQIIIGLFMSIKLLAFLGFAFWALTSLPLHRLGFAFGVMATVVEFLLVVLLVQGKVLREA